MNCSCWLWLSSSTLLSGHVRKGTVVLILARVKQEEMEEALKGQTGWKERTFVFIILFLFSMWVKLDSSIKLDRLGS
jgi:hypothetical protein